MTDMGTSRGEGSREQLVAGHGARQPFRERRRMGQQRLAAGRLESPEEEYRMYAVVM